MGPREQGKVVHFIQLVSPLHGKKRLAAGVLPFLRAIERQSGLTLTALPPEEFGKELLPLVFVQSGGVESFFRKLYPRLPQPIVLLSHPGENSLPASLEVLSYIQARGGKGMILHGSPFEVARQLSLALKAFEARRRLNSSRLGLVGAPSDWLIASRVDPEAVKRRWGCELIKIPWKEVLTAGRRISAPETEALIQKAEAVKGPSEKKIREAVGFWKALKNTVVKHKLDALSLRCFDLLKERVNTGCLALALLNDAGIPAACEGDIPALFTMLLGFYLTGTPAFMANPASADWEKNELVLAHCTLPLRLARSYSFMTHFESNRGVGIRGKIAPGPCVVAKVGGPSLSRFFLSSGMILANLRKNRLCRTQVRVKLEEKIADYFSRPLGNHLVVFPGDHLPVFRIFFQAWW